MSKPNAQHSVSLAMLATVFILAMANDWLADMKSWVQARTSGGGSTPGNAQQGSGLPGREVPGQIPPGAGRGNGGGGGGSW